MIFGHMGDRMLFHVKRNPEFAYTLSMEWLDILAFGPDGKVYTRSRYGFMIFRKGGIKIADSLAAAGAEGADFYMAEKDES